MTNQTIDNGADAEIGKVVLWQYDNAVHLLSMLGMMSSFHKYATKDLWDFYLNHVLDVENAGEFGLSVLGSLIGIGRPDVEIDDEVQPISAELYRKFIKARFKLISTSQSCADIAEYLDTIFGGGVKCADNGNMTISYSKVDASLTDEQIALIEQHPDFCFPFPAAVHDNTSFDEVFFGIVETQPSNDNVYMNGKLIAGLDRSALYDDFDDSEYIPENERIA